MDLPASPGRLGETLSGVNDESRAHLVLLRVTLAYRAERRLTPVRVGRRVRSPELTMRWYHYLAYFFGGAFLANSIPHLIQGLSGQAFQSPFASPPGEGLSSSTVNVLWGLFNLAVGYVLVCRVGKFDLRNTRQVLVLGAGVLLMSLMLARQLGRLHGGL